jgi:type IV fimbrial biogenesis protein FimT
MNKRAFRHIKNKGRGFTLVELMVTVAILVILLAIGAPQLQGFLAKRSVSTQADIFASALRMARSEAIKRGQLVTICASDAPEAAIKTCNGASDNWSTGWVVFVDGGTKSTIDGSDEVLAVQQSFPSTGGINPPAGKKQAISFAANGLAVGEMNSFDVKPKLTAADGSTFKCVALAASGRIKITDGACIR